MNSTKHDLAACYRIISLLGLDDHTYTHISSRSERGFYIYPFGMLFGEVRPQDLLEVTFEGKVLQGDEYQYNKTGYIIHGQLYKQRKDINSIIHLHTPEIVAVSSCSKGLMPISQWALHFYGKVSYHKYNSLALSPEQGGSILDDLGSNKVMLMQNHGSITCGVDIQEALFYSYHLQKACQTQCLALGMNENIIMPSDEICRQSVNDLLSFEKKLGHRDWQAWLRLL
ncbi:MAG TPA: class II aldolase/adducin family protein [Candidatus Megaira endosymbiont of Nemacystus decipiens]|nr:class II aldolase/adducin family protein [Candidatus Megaera endosymbiont of Nemacystus decipiens]